LYTSATSLQSGGWDIAVRNIWQVIEYLVDENTLQGRPPKFTEMWRVRTPKFCPIIVTFDVTAKEICEGETLFVTGVADRAYMKFTVAKVGVVATSFTIISTLSCAWVLPQLGAVMLSGGVMHSIKVNVALMMVHASRGLLSGSLCSFTTLSPLGNLKPFP
jgi:hypothetical protein